MIISVDGWIHLSPLHKNIALDVKFLYSRRYSYLMTRILVAIEVLISDQIYMLALYSC